MKWPADRKFTDAQGKILDHWRGPMSVLEPLLDLTPTQFAALQQMIAAFQDQDDEDADPGAAINLALPIDEEPLPSEDWLISYKNAAQAGRRVAMSQFPAIKLITSTPLTGLTDANIAIPTGFRDIEVRISNMSMSTTATPTIAYSEDGGSTFLSQLFQIFTQTFSQSGTSTTPTFSVTTGLSSNVIVTGSSLLKNYGSAVAKVTSDFGLYSPSGVAWVGSRYMGASTAPINQVQISASAGTFDAGTVDLIGIP